MNWFKVLVQLIQEVQEQIKLQKKEWAESWDKEEKAAIAFYKPFFREWKIATSLVKMLRTLGFNKKNLFCSSVPGYDIPEGEDIYDTLAAKFVIWCYVIFLLSEELLW